jgi:16S rRNA (uracil1498-N3)-methyltransferase
MSAPLFYHPNLRGKQDSITLSEETAKHVFQVLRMQTGDKIRLTDGEGVEIIGSLLQTGKKTGLLQPEEIKTHKDDTQALFLCIAFTRNASRNEWLLEKATELGVTHIVPLTTKRSEKIHIRSERWQHILIAGMIQSQRLFLPKLFAPQSLQAMIELTASLSGKYLAHCNSNFSRKPILEAISKDQTACICIGPEGDFSPEEIDLCMQQGFTGVSLSDARLRTETAAMVACTAFNLMHIHS